jgi:nucleotidyltransferase substrate binding protein (TIGR01987 family)
METDIRWLQRFSNLKKAYKKLDAAAKKKTLSDLEKEGLIQRFEYTYELSWNTLKDLLEYQGYLGITGSRDAFKIALQRDLITQGDDWMQMIVSRQKTSHMYDQSEADQIVELITKTYILNFTKLIKKLEEESDKLKNK